MNLYAKTRCSSKTAARIFVAQPICRGGSPGNFVYKIASPKAIVVIIFFENPNNYWVIVGRALGKRPYGLLRRFSLFCKTLPYGCGGS